MHIAIFNQMNQGISYFDMVEVDFASGPSTLLHTIVDADAASAASVVPIGVDNGNCSWLAPMLQNSCCC